MNPDFSFEPNGQNPAAALDLSVFGTLANSELCTLDPGWMRGVVENFSWSHVRKKICMQLKADSLTQATARN